MGPFSLNLLLVVLLLLPGVIGVLEVYRAEPIILRRTLPRNGSLVVLGAVPLLALAVHALWAIAIWLTGALHHIVPFVTLPFDPNPYRLLLAGPPRNAPSDLAIVYLLGFLLLTALTPEALYRAYLPWERRRRVHRAETNGGITRGDDVGWLTHLVRLSEPDDRALICYVLTTFGHETERVGYAGVVEEVSIDADGEVSSITLDDCDTFVLRLGRKGLEREPTERRRPLRYMTFRREHVLNMSFEVQEYERGEPDEVDEGSELDGTTR